MNDEETIFSGRMLKKSKFFGRAVLVSFMFLLLRVWIANGRTSIPHALNSIGIPSSEIVYEALDRLSEAALIAVVLAFTFERISEIRFHHAARRERESLKRDAFTAIFGHHIPEAVRREIIDQIFASPFTRTDTILQYFLEPLASDPRYLQVSAKVSYALRNTTFRTQPFKFWVAMERTIPELEAKHVRVQSLVVTGCERAFQLTSDVLANVGLQAENGLLYLQLDETGHHIEVRPDRPTCVVLEYQWIARRECGRISTSFRNHAWGLDVSVHLCDSLRDELEVSAFSAGAPLLATHKLKPETGYYDWDLGDRALLPGQGIDLRWRRRAPVQQFVYFKRVNVRHTRSRRRALQRAVPSVTTRGNGSGGDKA